MSTQPIEHRFFILNNHDCPEAEMITEKRGDGFYYIHPKHRDKPEFWGMQPENPTPVEDFGISLYLDDDGILVGVLDQRSTAVYRDGKPRRWQGFPSFRINLAANERKTGKPRDPHTGRFVQTAASRLRKRPMVG